MGFFLQVVGAGFLLLFVLVLVGGIAAFLVIRSKLRKFVKDVEKMAVEGGAKSWTATPRIHLRPGSSHAWKDRAGLEVVADALAQSGFAGGEDYQVPEMPGLVLRVFSAEPEPLLAAVYEVAPIGIWCDVVWLGTDGTSLTVTSNAQGKSLDKRPGHDKIYLVGHSVADLVTRAREETAGRAGRSVPLDAVPAHMEQAFADEMDWRNSRGAATEEEIERLALAQGKTVTSDEVTRTRQIMLERAAQGLHVALREKYLKTSGISAEDWEEQRDRLLFVHDQLTPDRVRGLLETVGLFPDAEDADWDQCHEYSAMPAETPGRAAFAALYPLVPEPKRPAKISEISEPVAADVYLLPPDGDY